MSLSIRGKLELLEELEKTALGRNAFRIEGDYKLDNRQALFAVYLREYPEMLFIVFDLTNGQFDLVERPSGRLPQSSYRATSYASALQSLVVWAEGVNEELSAMRLVEMLENGDDKDVDAFFETHPGLEFEPFAPDQQQHFDSVVESWEEILQSVERQTAVPVDVFNRLVSELQRLRETLIDAQQGAWFRRARRAYNVLNKIAKNQKLQLAALNFAEHYVEQKMLKG
jgi:hypothetical protein